MTMQSPKKRILLVEDFEDSRFSLSKLLELEGYEVIEATDGAQAVDIAQKENPDLILMDLSLPVIDGLSATQIIRGTVGFSDVPIIALSGHDPDEIDSAARTAGCTDYVTKPIDFDRLISLITRHLSRS
jgi:two-component system, cell cycle response regulator DivK